MKRARASWHTRLASWPVWKKFSPAEWTLMVIGVITIFFIFITLFTGLSDNTPPPSIARTIPLNDPAFLPTLSSTINAPVEDGAPIRILVNGADFLPDLLGEIRNAKHSIYATDYIWDGGTFGDTLLEALIAKAKDGVAVRILFDGTSGLPTKKLVKELTDAGGVIAYFRPVRWWNLTRVDRRTHVRDFVIDDTTAYIGGVAISDAWLGDATAPTEWHDYMYKFAGAPAARATAVFSNMWSQTTGENLVAGAPARKAPAQGQTVSLLSQPMPDLSENVEQFLWLSISGSQSSIHIESPYLLPQRPLLNALEERARSGVDVEIVIPGDKTDAKYTWWASQSFYSELLAAGVKIYEYQPSRIHAKVMTMDGKWSIIGSANLDERSSILNLEYIMGVFDPGFAKAVEGQFEIDRANSREITKAEWDRTSKFMAPVRLLSRIFIHQY